MTTAPTVRLIRTGGFANIPMETEVPITDLPSDLQAALAALPPPSRKRSVSAGRPDSFTYELVVPTGRRIKTYRFGEGSTPEALKAILSHLSPGLAPHRK